MPRPKTCALLALVFLCGCQSQAVDCGACAPPLNVTVRVPARLVGFTVRVCVADLPCTVLTREPNRPLYETVPVDLQKHKPADMDGKSARVTLTDTTSTLTRTATMRYHDFSGDGPCACSDAHAEARF